MWICKNDAFLSIVKKECGPNELLVRARRPGDIERVFPDAKVTSAPGTDYQFRAAISRIEVVEALAACVEEIDYPNFKNSVKDRRLHDAYASFWNVHARLQPLPPYSRSHAPSKGRKPAPRDLS